MQYSPKLKKAMEDIKKIIKDNDIAAFIVLHDETGFSEYLNAVSPSYSCAFLTEDGMRFRLKAAEVGSERAKEIANGTFNMLTHLADMIAKHAMMYMDAQKILKDKWGGTQGPPNESSHNQQNN
jgi:hypothetical protein